MSSKYSYVISEQAEDEIQCSCFYLVNIVGNQIAVNELYSQLYSSLDLICEYPYMYPDCRIYNIQDELIRHANVGSYVLVYQIEDAKSLIDVLHFFGKNQNIAKLMEKNSYLN